MSISFFSLSSVNPNHPQQIQSSFQHHYLDSSSFHFALNRSDTVQQPLLVGGWPTPLKTMKVSWDGFSMLFPTYGKNINKKLIMFPANQPTNQPVSIWWIHPFIAVPQSWGRRRPRRARTPHAQPRPRRRWWRRLSRRPTGRPSSGDPWWAPADLGWNWDFRHGTGIDMIDVTDASETWDILRVFVHIHIGILWDIHIWSYMIIYVYNTNEYSCVSITREITEFRWTQKKVNPRDSWILMLEVSCMSMTTPNPKNGCLNSSPNIPSKSPNSGPENAEKKTRFMDTLLNFEIFWYKDVHSFLYI